MQYYQLTVKIEISSVLQFANLVLTLNLLLVQWLSLQVKRIVKIIKVLCLNVLCYVIVIVITTFSNCHQKQLNQTNNCVLKHLSRNLCLCCSTCVVCLQSFQQVPASSLILKTTKGCPQKIFKLTISSEMF